MRKLAFYLCIVLQFVALAYMAGNREYIRAYGDEVWLPTAPIDPRDPFRGDFVRLQYAINHVPAPQSLQAEDFMLKGTVVYARLREAARGTFEFSELSLDPPSRGTFLKGRVTGQQLWRGTHINVNYGIEQLFVQQGRGREIEARRGSRTELQVPLEALVAVGGDGTGVIKDYRWGALGARLEIVRSNRRDPSGVLQSPGFPPSPKLRFTLANVSAGSLSIIESADQCQFVVVPAFDPAYPPLSTPQRCGAGFDSVVRSLAPGEEAAYEIDLALPAWQVRIGDEHGELGVLIDNWNEMYRLVYRPIADGRDVWQGQLPSRAFNMAGRID